MNKILSVILICFLLILGASDAKQVMRLPSAEAGNLITGRAAGPGPGPVGTGWSDDFSTDPVINWSEIGCTIVWRTNNALQISANSAGSRNCISWKTDSPELNTPDQYVSWLSIHSSTLQSLGGVFFRFQGTSIDHSFYVVRIDNNGYLDVYRHTQSGGSISSSQTIEENGSASGCSYSSFQYTGWAVQGTGIDTVFSFWNCGGSPCDNDFNNWGPANCVVDSSNWDSAPNPYVDNAGIAASFSDYGNYRVDNYRSADTSYVFP